MRKIFAAAAPLLLIAPATAAPPPEVAGKDASALQLEMEEGRTTSESITAAYLERIRAIDDEGPALNAVIATLPDALGEARRLDAERKAGRVRGPLHGIPVLLKDNIE
ncbi:MAG TPA: amidase family protein, partial [Sphingopyxis sp.]|nr:amidase family protein [Sphingopyxis sp.]